MLSYLVLLLACSLAQGQFLGPEPIDLPTNKAFSTLEEAIQNATLSILNQKEASNLPSLAFAISVKGKTVYENAWGWADLENSVPATVATKYRLASVSKTFTTTLVGTLVDQGLLKYDDLISKYLPTTLFPPKTWNGKQVNITLGQLLSHMAGAHFSLMTDFDDLFLATNVTQMIPKLAQEPLLFAPGSNFTYSNYGFQLVGAIIESVTKKTFPQAVSELFHTLGLNSTFAETPNQLIHNRARYYLSPDPAKNPKENVKTRLLDDLFYLEGYWPSGGLMSTVGDLLTFGNHLVDSYKGRAHALLSKATLGQIWTERAAMTIAPFSAIKDTKYGYGWFIANITKSTNPNLKYRKFNYHGGNLMGATTHLVVYPEEEMVAAVLTNKGYAPDLDKMAQLMAENIYPFIKK